MEISLCFCGGSFSRKPMLSMDVCVPVMGLNLILACKHNSQGGQHRLISHFNQWIPPADF